MKKLATLILCAGMLLGAATGASAIDFKARGQWLMGFGLLDSKLIHKTRQDWGRAGQVKTKNLKDEFFADQRIRLWLDAVASENLSGTLGVEVGTQTWGQSDSGAALGADGKIVKVKNAYIDWMVPDMPLKMRMGIQSLTLPSTAGGSAIMDTDVAAVTASYQVNDNIGVTAFWARPLNDNWDGGNNRNRAGYLDNLDLFALTIPLTFDGIEVTPWAMIGMKGANAMKGDNNIWGWHDGVPTNDGNLPLTLYPYNSVVPFNMIRDQFGSDEQTMEKLAQNTQHGTGKAYGTLFWAGLPINISMWDPLNIQFDFNYGYSEPMGRYLSGRMKDGRADWKWSSTERQGWLAKALVEYKMDWGVPGIFGWYASGDDDDPKNGSERMPSIVPMGTFTSFMGDGYMGWPYNDYAVDYSGTWGIGLQLRDMSFIEDLSSTFRVAYWGGTNDPKMAKYMVFSNAWDYGWGSNSSPYLTTNDGLLEFNLVTTYKMYENFDVVLDLAYVANYMDNDTWNKAGLHNTTFQKQDAWKAGLIFEYSF